MTVGVRFVMADGIVIHDGKEYAEIMQIKLRRFLQVDYDQASKI